ncbi:MAG: Cof-type HAD-IIB family hydrolase [Candidatus Hydrogenedens sp.]|nr:Cof-type HAD-IIB family hydrolase [Candidatus Hydrogenedens sp.]
MSYRWIVSDIDGCLSPETSEAWNWDTFKQLAEFFHKRRRNSPYPVPLILCTGRPQPYVEVWAKIFDLRAPLVCENGAVIYTLKDNMSRFGPGVTSEKIQGLRNLRLFIEKELLSKQPEVIYQFGKEAQLSLFSQKPELFNEMIDTIYNFVKQQGGPELVIQPSHYYLNISLAGVNKGKAIKVILNELESNRNEAVGIGDTSGDIAIREQVAFFACPANAHKEIKEYADYISPHPDILGVLDILQQPPFMSVWTTV